MKMLRYLLILAVLESCYGQEDVNKLLQDIFGLPTTEPPPQNEVYETPVCYTKSGVEGQCMQPFNCVTGKSNDRKDFRGPCKRNKEVCCPFDELTFSGTEDTENNEQEQASNVTKKLGCGMRNQAVFSAAEITEDKAAFGEYPWIVAVLNTKLSDPKDPSSELYIEYLCSGSVIHPKVIMTTAHQTYNKTSLRVRAGEWDIRSTEEAYPYQERLVKSVLFHEKFNTVRLNLRYDIALLVLDKPLDIKPNVNTLCLPKALQETPAGSICFSSGWGKDEFERGTYQAIPKKVSMPIVEHGACQSKLRTTRLGEFFRLHASFLCAGGESNKDSCLGDGGSALMCSIPGQDDRFMATGMVSWGIGCGANTPGVYANVAFLRSWVDEKMQSLGFNADTYTY